MVGSLTLLTCCSVSSCLLGLSRVAQGQDWEARYVVDGTSENQRFGSSVSSAGDVNKDSYSDFIVGAPGESNPRNKPGAGSARVFSGKDGKILYTFYGESAGDQLGGSVSEAGDVNADGYGDVVVGARDRAFVFSGKDGSIVYTHFGYSVVSKAGDVNADGFDDVLLGAPQFANGGFSRGLATVFSGRTGEIVRMIYGAADFEELGRSVSGAGDINRDGFDDFIVGGPGGVGSGGTPSGVARVFSGKDQSFLYAFPGDGERHAFASSVAGAGDVNADGFPDVLVGSGYPFWGRHYVKIFSGKDGKVLYHLPGNASDAFGGSVSGAGDVNRDGFDDFIVGARNYAQVFSGKDGSAFLSVSSGRECDDFCTAVAGVGDVDGDGFDDVIVGTKDEVVGGSDSGRVSVYGDSCPTDRQKGSPGQCGCGVVDTDGDGDGIADCNDQCPSDANKIVSGQCGCGVIDTDLDMDGVADCNDTCPNDARKVAPGVCGCGVVDTDVDKDGTPDCNDTCPNDLRKIAPGVCGCGVTDSDLDKDGAADCYDQCPSDPIKSAPGQCGCGVVDTDTDKDGVADCNDPCSLDASKIKGGQCGCGIADTDTDKDGTPDCNDSCSSDANKTAPGGCGCGVSDTDTDKDGTPDCNDSCSLDAGKTTPGQCGCGVADTDTDKDGSPDCSDRCPNDPSRVDACSSFDNKGVEPTPTPTPKPLHAPSVRVTQGSAEVWAQGRFASQDRVTFSIAGPKTASLRGKRFKGNAKGTLKFQASFRKLPKGTYRAFFAVLRSGAERRTSALRAFRVK